MQITLRKANAIQASIQDAIKSISPLDKIELNEFQDVAAELLKANALVIKNLQRHAALLFAMYNIRGSVGTANSQSGIDLLLTDAAYMDRQVAQLNLVSSSAPMTDIVILQGKIDKLQANLSTTRSLYAQDTVSTSVISQVQIDNAKKDILALKKQKQKINDQVLELNIKTTITLPEQVVATLTEEGLI